MNKFFKNPIIKGKDDVEKILKRLEQEEINPYKQFLGRCLKPFWIVLLIVLILLLIPMTPELDAGGQPIVTSVYQQLARNGDPSGPILITYSFLITGAYTNLLGQQLYKMTHNDIVKWIKRSNRQSQLFTYDEELALCQMVWDAEKKQADAKKKRKEEQLASAQQKNQNDTSQLMQDVATILKEKQDLEKELQEYKELEQEVAAEELKKQKKESLKN